MTLVEDKNFKEVGEILYLTPAHISELFYRAVKRVSQHCKTFNEQLKIAIIMQKEIRFLTKKSQQHKNLICFLPLEMREMLCKGIKEFDFSVRVINACRAANIKTLAELVKYSKRDLMRFSYMGKRSTTEIEEFFLSKGLSWGMDV